MIADAFSFFSEYGDITGYFTSNGYFLNPEAVLGVFRARSHKDLWDIWNQK
jgi:hypothetical protein